MNPIVGVDVAKGMSVVQAFMRRNSPFGRDERIMHKPKGFERLRELLIELELKSGYKPCIILEPTGHYHRVLVMYLQREGYEVILVNPLQAQRARRTGLRKVKTDASDAWHLGDLYYQEENWTALPIREECLMDLQFLTRQHEFVTSIYVQSKLNMRSLVDQVFPGYEGVFRDLFSKLHSDYLKIVFHLWAFKSVLINSGLNSYASLQGLLDRKSGCRTKSRVSALLRHRILSTRSSSD